MSATAHKPVCKHQWLDDVALHASQKTPKSNRLSGSEMTFAVHLKSVVRDGVGIVNAEGMAQRTGIPHRTVRRYFRAFESWKFIAVEWSAGGAKGHKIELLDASKAVVDRDWSKGDTRPLMSGRVAEENSTGGNEATRPPKDGQETRPLHAGAGKYTGRKEEEWGPPRAPHSVSSSTVQSTTPASSSEIDNGAGAGREPAPATSSRSDCSSVTAAEPEPLQKDVDAVGSVSPPAASRSAEFDLEDENEHCPFGSSGDSEDDYPANKSPFDAALANEDEEDDLSWWDAPPPPSRTPIADLFREERNDLIASFAQLREFAAEKGLNVSEEELADLEEELGWSEDHEAQASGLPVDRAPDEDDLDRLRRGALVDRHGRPFVIERDGSAYRMLSDDVRRAAFVGKRCDQLAALRPSERPAAWKKTCADMHRLLGSEGYGTPVYDRLIEPLSAEVKTEMNRRVSAFSRHFQEANS